MSVEVNKSGSGEKRFRHGHGKAAGELSIGFFTPG
jgi:hypothetical protein